MDLTNAKKLSYAVNTLLLGFVLGMLAFFAYFHVDALTWFSIPTIGVYLINYGLIHKGRLSYFVRLVCFWIDIYMMITTLCLGYSYGFHLYSMSLIPIAFCTEYMSYKLKSKGIHPLNISIVIAVTYLFSTGYSIVHGPFYRVGGIAPNLFLFVNAVAVFGFLIFYTRLLLKMVIGSEEKLVQMAHRDRLTGLYNRHYMLDRLTALTKDADTGIWAAMVDIDDFKKINDNYGHNCGDYVLIRMSEILNEICKECSVSRWGGEEFLIISDKVSQDVGLLEKLRQEVERNLFVYEGTQVKVTITVGAAKYRAGQSIDEWIHIADSRLYYGKKSGKNKVVAEDTDIQ